MKNCIFLALFCCFGLVTANVSILAQNPAKDTLNVVSYNVLNFPSFDNPSTDLRHPYFGNIMHYIEADVIMAVELTEQRGADSLFTALNSNGVDYYEQSEFTIFDSNFALGNMLYYNSNKLGLLWQDTIDSWPRAFNHYHLYIKEPDLACHQDTTFLEVFAVHFKAGRIADNPQNEDSRQDNATDLMNYINALPANNNMVVGGDFNFYSGDFTDNNDPYYEPGYGTLIDAANTHPLIDMVGYWEHENEDYAAIYTQSTRSSFYPADGEGSPGGIDDRFDMQLINENIRSGLEGITLVPDSYTAYGNDGIHFDMAIIDPWANVPDGSLNLTLPDEVVMDLFNMSDHLPILTKMEVAFSQCAVPLVEAQVKVLLEGPYDTLTQLMRTDLLAGNILKIEQPYGLPPYNYLGLEMVADANSFPADVVDWVYLELLNANDSTILEDERAALLLNDGTVINQDGTPLSFERAIDGESYYLRIRHRNHIDVLSAFAVILPNTTPYDFSDPTNVVSGTEQLSLLSDGTYALKAADINGNGVITYTDANQYFTEQTATDAYLNSDCNLDGVLDALDINLWLKNRSAIGIDEIRY